MGTLFKINSKPSKKSQLIVGIGGFVFIVSIWMFFTSNIGKPVVDYSSLPGRHTGDTISEYPLIVASGDTLECLENSNYYQWYFNNEKIEGADRSIFSFNEQGSYTVEISDTSGRSFLSDSIPVMRKPLVSKGVLPSPWKMVLSFGELHTEDALLRNAGYSVMLNLTGYLEAIFASLLLGFIIGLIPFFRSFLSRYVDAIRFLPLTAVTGLFIAWFGIEMNMKVQFLAFGIFVYLLPVVVQRIDEIDKIYLQTAYTLGANNWQTVRTVYWPSVSSRIFDDIRVLTAISWTYIIVAEMINRTGGVGSLVWLAARQSRLDKVFAILFVIILIGIIQDRLFLWLDRFLFPFKHK